MALNNVRDAVLAHYRFFFFLFFSSFSARDQSLASIKYFSQKILEVSLVVVSR